MAELNCDKCRYRYWLARYDVHITADDCDKRGEELCKKMNDPAFIKWMDDNKGRKERQ